MSSFRRKGLPLDFLLQSQSTETLIFKYHFFHDSWTIPHVFLLVSYCPYSYFVKDYVISNYNFSKITSFSNPVSKFSIKYQHLI